MTLTLHDTSKWPAERLDWPNIAACLKRYADRFPTDATIKSILADLVSGDLRLWVVRDEEDRTVAAVLVAVSTTRTGALRVSIHGYGGTRGVEAFPLVTEIEDWARSIGADEFEVVGRKGWRRMFERLGYREEAVILRKRLP